jgi:hypothetical protein
VSVAGACSSSSTPSDTTGQGTSAAVPGAADDHCKEPDGGTRVQETNSSSCSAAFRAFLRADDGGSADAGGDDGGGGGGMDEGVPMYNSEGSDDDCKYHVKWTSNAAKVGQDVTFGLMLTTSTDGMPATGAAPYIEASLSDTHLAPSVGTGTEIGGGQYSIGPVRFDASGQWTVRFHVFGTCSDDPEDSPHSHAAFYVNVQ